MPLPFLPLPTNPPWVKQFNPPPGQGTLTAPRPATPRGLYQFGMPEALVRIHFPDGNDRNFVKPWYWYYTTQTPQYFSYLAGVWGPGFVRLPIFSVVKILAIDTQPMRPVPSVGFSSVENAARAGNPASFGRIDFRAPYFWWLTTNALSSGGVPQDKPRFGVDNNTGLIYSQEAELAVGSVTQTFDTQIEQFVRRYETRWNQLVVSYNAQTAGVSPSGGFQYVPLDSTFPVELPTGPPTFLTQFATELRDFTSGGDPINGRYMGPIPGTAFFNITTLTTQAWAFEIAFGQLDDTAWDMSVFPPREASNSLTIKPSSVTQDYRGFGPTPVPFAGPQIL